MIGNSKTFPLLLVSPSFNLLNAELNSICHLHVLLGAHHILHVSRIRVKTPVYGRHARQ